MLDIPLRQLKDDLLNPVSRWMPAFVRPNHLTLMAFLLGLGGCLAATVPCYEILSISLWMLNRILDCLDGSLARVQGSATELGGFLDLLCDFTIYSLIPLAVGIGQDKKGREADWRAIATLEAAIHINNFVLFYTAAVVAKTDIRKTQELTGVSMQPALIEGFEAGVFFTIMLVFPKAIGLTSWLMAAAVGLGTIQRVIVVIPALARLSPSSDVDSRVKES